VRQGNWLRLEPLIVPLRFDPDGGLEVLVLEGGFSEGGETYGPQSWLRLPIGAHFSARVATDGCRVWIKEGHLRHVQGMRPTGEGSRCCLVR
jgi:ChrR Cupin-like domain